MEYLNQFQNLEKKRYIVEQKLKKFQSVFPHTKEIIRTLNHPVEFETALWCISYFTALQLTPKSRYIVISYEGLSRRGYEELTRLFNFLQIDMPEGATARLKDHSLMTKKDSPLYTSKDPLAKWKDALSDDEIGMILNVVQKFGLDFYGENIEPDYSKLYNYTPSFKV